MSYQIVSVKDFGAQGNGVADDTTAIQSAINSGNKTIFTPRGIYKITSTIHFGSQTASFKSFRFYGEGGNENGTDPSRGSTILWKGAANGIAVEITSASKCRFERFSVDGGGTASVCMLVDAKNTGGGANFNNIFDDISFSAVPQGIGLLISGNQFGLIDQDVSQSVYNNISFYRGYAAGASSVKTAIKQEGRQTVANRFYNTILSGFSFRGVDIQAGDAVFYGPIFNGAKTGANIDDVYIGNGVDWVQFHDNYHEVTSDNPLTRHAFNFPDGNRIFPTTLDSVRVRWGVTSGNPLYFKQSGRLTMIGGSWDGSPGGQSTLQIENIQPAIIHGVYFAAHINYNITGQNSVL